MDIFKVLFLLLLLYVFSLFILKILGIWRKEACDECLNCCPICKGALDRVRRRKIDYIRNHLTLHIFDFKRYVCKKCNWDGLKWESLPKPDSF